ncbi:MAG TPA: response regulator [Terriglobales bacterium]|jgi:YesN/AraC family two-component response regulator|nr:response regulator [Terriglobales bacterium]
MQVRKTRILFADDEPGIRLTLPLILEQEGFAVSVAGTVAEALAYINRDKFDVLLADLNIGEKGDGFTLISAMRRVQPSAVTLILSGYPDFATALEAIRNQVDDYLTKPAEVKHLVETIKEKAKQPRRVTPIQVKRLSAILRESVDEIAAKWLSESSQNTMLSSIPLSKKERLDHVRLIIEELAKRIEAGPNVIANSKKPGATTHGRERFEQGYTTQRIAIEARLLHIVLSRVLHKHFLSVDMSTCISDMMLMGEALHEEFEESIRAFEEQSSFGQTA